MRKTPLTHKKVAISIIKLSFSFKYSWVVYYLLMYLYVMDFSVNYTEVYRIIMSNYSKNGL